MAFDEVLVQGLVLLVWLAPVSSYLFLLKHSNMIHLLNSSGFMQTINERQQFGNSNYSVTLCEEEWLENL